MKLVQSKKDKRIARVSNRSNKDKVLLIFRDSKRKTLLPSEFREEFKIIKIPPDAQHPGENQRAYYFFLEFLQYALSNQFEHMNIKAFYDSLSKKSAATDILPSRPTVSGWASVNEWGNRLRALRAQLLKKKREAIRLKFEIDDLRSYRPRQEIAPQCEHP